MKHNLAESTRRICGDNPPHKNPERWVAIQLRTGRFRGQKIGRYWFMTDADIEAAEQSLYTAPEPALKEESPGIINGLSERGRRRLRSVTS